jgi:hypothetical protein
MAHETQVTGAYSELMAEAALLANGYEVARPIAPESYDMVARNPLTNDYQRIQVKTVRVREDRGGALVVYARRSNGEAYSADDCDAFIGVNGDDVYMFDNRVKTEYWSDGADFNGWTLLRKGRRAI